MNRPTCKCCGTPMKVGKAIRQTHRGLKNECQLPGGPGRLVSVWKCPKCGHFKII